MFSILVRRHVVFFQSIFFIKTHGRSIPRRLLAQGTKKMVILRIVTNTNYDGVPFHLRDLRGVNSVSRTFRLKLISLNTELHKL